MKKLLMIILPLMMVFNTALANQSSQNKYVKMMTDTLRANYKITSIPTINIDVKYSNVTIIEGDNDEVDIVSTVTLKGKGRRITEELMEQINIEMSQSGNRINIETDFNDSFNNVSIEINFLIKVPYEFVPDVEIKYGNLTISSIAIGGSIEAKYSNLDAQQLKGLTELDVKYSNIKIDKAETLELDAKYSNIDIGTVNNFESEYFAYGDLQIGKVINTLEIDDFAYASFSVYRFSLDMSKIIINAKYSPIEILLPKGLIVDANVTAHNSELSILGMKGFTKKPDGETTKIRNLSRGISKHVCFVDIISSYGDIEIEQE